MAGETYGVGLSMSGSSSADSGLSGATEVHGGGVFGGVTYGPGTVVNAQPSSATPATSSGLFFAALGIGVAVYLVTRKK